MEAALGAAGVGAPLALRVDLEVAREERDAVGEVEAGEDRLGRQRVALGVEAHAPELAVVAGPSVASRMLRSA